MGIELIFRTGYYCVALLLYFYGHMLCTSTAILGFLAWLGYGHPGHNSAEKEVVAFFITAASALATAVLIGGVSSPTWVFDYELNIVLRRWSRLKTSDAVRWAMAMASGLVAYASTEMLGYDQGTLLRVNGFLLLTVLMILLWCYDRVVVMRAYSLLPPEKQRRHLVVALFIMGAIFIDILVRDPQFWPYAVCALGAWLLLQVPKLFVSSRLHGE